MPVVRSSRFTATTLFFTLASALVYAQAPAAQPDAVIELWEQHWTLNSDGSLVYLEKRHVRLFSDRVFGEYGDPRLGYDSSVQNFELLAARVKRPSGEYVDLPPYARVESAMGGAAGWPAFSGLREFIPVISGIEPGCVVELEHRVTSKPGTRSGVEADLRLDNRFEVKSRVVEVSVPANMNVAYRLSGIAEDRCKHVSEKRPDGGTRHEWRVENLPERLDEPSGLPWEERCARLRVTTSTDEKAWIAKRLSEIETAADESPLIVKLAKEWTKDAATSGEKLSAIQDKLSSTFNFVRVPADLRPAPRKASEVIQSNYGIPEEAAALLISLARSAGVSGHAGLLLEYNAWEDDVPIAADVADYLLVREDGGEVEFWRPQNGVIERDIRGAGYSVVTHDGATQKRIPMPFWNAADDCRVEVGGAVALKDDGSYSGKLTFRSTGAFVSTQALRSRDAQSRRVKSLTRRVLPDAEVTEFTVKSLSANVFEVEANVTGKGREKVANCWRLTLADDGPCAEEIGLPLAQSRRLTPARVATPFVERVDLRVEWPSAWKVDVKPMPLKTAKGEWGAAEQSVTVDGASARVQRMCRIESRDLTPAQVLDLRGPFNALRSEAARTFMFRP